MACVWTHSRNVRARQNRLKWVAVGGFPRTPRDAGGGGLKNCREFTAFFLCLWMAPVAIAVFVPMTGEVNESKRQSGRIVSSSSGRPEGLRSSQKSTRNSVGNFIATDTRIDVFWLTVPRRWKRNISRLTLAAHTHS